jgi:hypothetical protein
MRRALLSSIVLLSACGLFGPSSDNRIDEQDGVPDIAGNETVDIPSNFTCGMPITSNGIIVTTTVVSGGCEFKLDQDVQVLTAADYQSYAELASIGTKLVKSVEIKILTLEFKDASSGQVLDLQTRVTSATLSINGQQVADKAALANLPFTATLEGNALTPIKSKIEAKQPVSVRASSVVVLPNSPAPPAKLGIKYEAKPAIILGI